MPADVRFTKPEMWLLFRLARRDYVQATDRSERIRASVIHKIGTALGLPRTLTGDVPAPTGENDMSTDKKPPTCEHIVAEVHVAATRCRIPLRRGRSAEHDVLVLGGPLPR